LAGVAGVATQHPQPKTPGFTAFPATSAVVADVGPIPFPSGYNYTNIFQTTEGVNTRNTRKNGEDAWKTSENTPRVFARVSGNTRGSESPNPSKSSESPVRP
jgi:hypothetical protein